MRLPEYERYSQQMALNDDLRQLRDVIGPSSVLLTRVHTGPTGQQEINQTVVDGLSGAREFVAEVALGVSGDPVKIEEALRPHERPASELPTHALGSWSIDGASWSAQPYSA